jgi:hypothetical protein
MSAPKLPVLFDFSKPSLWAIGIYTGLMLVGNLIWEFAHMPLYTLWEEGTTAQIITYGLHCTAGDVIIALSSLLIALLITGRRSSWLSSMLAFKRTVYLAMLFGVSYTIFSEYLNTEIRQSWAYTSAMPTIPVFGTGLSPFLQWLILPGLGYWWIGRKFIGKGA